jgi:tRNA-dihydrouridine synthase B
MLHPALAALGAETPVFVAPMTGITDRPFRRAVRRFGAGMVYSEMLASRLEVEELRGSAKASGSYADEYPMGVQLAGCEPDVMAEAARINADRGAKLIDLNFGCPVKKVVNKMGGSALMRDEHLSTRIMEAVVAAVPHTAVTVKMRLGWDDASRNAATLVRIAGECGIRAVTVHGRTRMQMYTGAADWQAVRAIEESTKLPVIINGDITDAAGAREALRQSGADAVMVGRGAQGRPWIAHEIAAGLYGRDAPAPMGDRLLNVILQHYEELVLHMGTHLGMLNGRKHIGWYLKEMPESADLRARINTQDDPAAVMQILRDYFAGLEDQPPPSAR